MRFQPVALTVLLFGSSITLAQVPPNERDALIALYDSTGGPNWTSQGNWRHPSGTGMNDPGTECTWGGVICEGGHVDTLALAGNNLVGVIPPEIGDLAELTILYLNMNDLYGSVPKEIGDLSQLHILDLKFNQLNGELPKEIGNLTNLVYLWLNDNQLSGGMPVELGNLELLYYLDLSENRLTGTIPSELNNIDHLISLKLWGNRLVGPVPPEIVDLVWLQSLYVGYNGLWADDQVVSDFLSSHDPYWQLSQTVPPGNVEVGSTTATSTTATWTPIEYTSHTGRYEIGPPPLVFADGFESGDTSGWLNGGTLPSLLPTTYVTIDKTESSILIEGLSPGTTYRFVVRTITDPHEYNQSQVTSVPSQTVVFQTLP